MRYFASYCCVGTSWGNCRSMLLVIFEELFLVLAVVSQEEVWENSYRIVIGTQSFAGVLRRRGSHGRCGYGCRGG